MNIRYGYMDQKLTNSDSVNPIHIREIWTIELNFAFKNNCHQYIDILSSEVESMKKILNSYEKREKSIPGSNKKGKY